MNNFSSSYSEARGKFLSACIERGASITTYHLNGVKGELNETLATDVACLGSQSASRAVLLITGTHGVEGFCGSAILHSWLVRERQGLKDIKLVLVHAINPWAFSYRTRADEDNVDLNRNCLLDDTAYKQLNPVYDAITHLIHADPSNAAEALRLHTAYKAYFDQNGWQLENEIWQGQLRNKGQLLLIRWFREFPTGERPQQMRLIMSEKALPSIRLGA